MSNEERESIEPPVALVLGCNTPVGIGVLSDWIEEQTGHAPDFNATGFPVNNVNEQQTDRHGNGDGNGYGFDDGNGSGDGWSMLYSDFDGGGYGDGYEYGYEYGYDGGEGSGVGRLFYGSRAHGGGRGGGVFTHSQQVGGN